MNRIIKLPRETLGYQFIPKPYLPENRDEYYFRNLQNPKNKYRSLTGPEREALIRQGNTSDDWEKILVSENFDPGLVKNSRFFGLVRIGNLEPYCLEYHNLRMSVGIYNSTILSSDLGDNVCIENVPYLSHYIIGNEVMLANIHELATTSYAKFGNGILKDGEEEKVRIWIELRNETGGRKIIPFHNMEPGDAFLWSEFPEDRRFNDRLKEMTARTFSSDRGYYGTIGDRCVIKDCDIIKDVKIGTDAYIKGANKLKNLTIHSDEKCSSQIGEGCELVNGIIGFGCRIFYGVKAVRFILAEHSQLKYGARLINSYLGSNSTISCCEVLNSLIFPGHEQHHNNSFLTAAMIQGQSNVAAGATIGSNHNSRAADGEFVAGRGFWPGLSVSMKHDSRFASYCILVKGDYPHELNIPIPFTLVSNNPAANKLELRPGYWFRHNMYAIARNAQKHRKRDKREHLVQLIEYDFLAPDTVNEIFEALQILEPLPPDEQGHAVLENIENSRRICEVKKVRESVDLFKELIVYYGVCRLTEHIRTENPVDFGEIKRNIPAGSGRTEWINTGGQLILKSAVEGLREDIKSGRINSWEEVHDFYRVNGERYERDKLHHAVCSLLEIENVRWEEADRNHLKDWLIRALKTREWLTRGICESRQKDYDNPFRKMMYRSEDQMNAVVGKLEDNVFIREELEKTAEFRKTVGEILKNYG